MSPSEYELVVGQIVEGMLETAPELSSFVGGFGVGAKNRIAGESGYRHQIDISVLGESLTYIVECKRFNKKVGVNEVLVLLARGSDISALRKNETHCILVTTKGISRHAKKIAGHYGIQVEIVRSPQEFGMQIGKRIQVGLLQSIQLTDVATAWVIPVGKG